MNFLSEFREEMWLEYQLACQGYFHCWKWVIEFKETTETREEVGGVGGGGEESSQKMRFRQRLGILLGFSTFCWHGVRAFSNWCCETAVGFSVSKSSKFRLWLLWQPFVCLFTPASFNSLEKNANQKLSSLYLLHIYLYIYMYVYIYKYMLGWMFVVGLRSHQDPAMRCVASLLLKLAGGNFSNLQLASWVRWPPSLCSKLATDGVDLALSSEIVSRGGGGF